MTQRWRESLGAAAHQRVAALWLYLATLVAALPAALVVARLVGRRFGSSLAGPDFARGVDAGLWAELLRTQAPMVKALGPLLLGGALLWLVVSTFLNGAVLAAVSGPVPPRTGVFFADGGRVFGRLLRLLPLGGLWTAAAAGLPLFGLWKLVGVATEDWVSERGVLAVDAVALLLTLLVVAWVNGAYDLMKIEAVTRGERRAHFAFAHGVRAALKQPGGLLAIYLPLAGAAVGLTLLASLLDVHLPRSGWGSFSLGVCLQQVVAIGRAVLRVGLSHAEVAWVRGGTASGRVE